MQLDDLAPELLALTMVYLDATDLAHMEMTCEKFRSVAKKYAWKALYVNKYGQLFATFSHLKQEKKKLQIYYNANFEANISTMEKEQVFPVVKKFTLLNSCAVTSIPHLVMPNNIKQTLGMMYQSNSKGLNMPLKKRTAMAITSRHMNLVYAYKNNDTNNVYVDLHDMVSGKRLVKEFELFQPESKNVIVSMCMEVLPNETLIMEQHSVYGLYATCGLFMHKYKVIVTGAKATIQLMSTINVPAQICILRCMEQGMIVGGAMNSGFYVWRDGVIVLVVGSAKHIINGIPLCTLPNTKYIRSVHAIYLGQNKASQDCYEIRCLDQTSEVDSSEKIFFVTVTGNTATAVVVDSAHGRRLETFGRFSSGFDTVYSECGRFSAGYGMVANNGSFIVPIFHVHVHHYTFDSKKQRKFETLHSETCREISGKFLFDISNHAAICCERLAIVNCPEMQQLLQHHRYNYYNSVDEEEDLFADDGSTPPAQQPMPIRKIKYEISRNDSHYNATYLHVTESGIAVFARPDASINGYVIEMRW